MPKAETYLLDLYEPQIVPEQLEAPQVTKNGPHIRVTGNDFSGWVQATFMI